MACLAATLASGVAGGDVVPTIPPTETIAGYGWPPKAMAASQSLLAAMSPGGSSGPIVRVGHRSGVAALTTLPQPQPGDEWGFALAADDTGVWIAAPGRDGILGSDIGVVVRVADQGAGFTAIATIPGTFAASGFGRALSAANGILVVGAPSTDSLGVIDSGAVEVWADASGGQGLAWQLVQTILPPSPSSLGQFGTSVALDGDRLVIGEPYATVGSAFATGRAWIFHRGRDGLFGLEASISGLASFDLLGIRVALRGERCAIGVPADGRSLTGEAWLFEHGAGGWVQTETFTDERDTTYCRSVDVRLTPTRVVVSALVFPDQGPCGSSIIYHLLDDNWSPEAMLDSGALVVAGDEAFTPGPYFELARYDLGLDCDQDGWLDEVATRLGLVGDCNWNHVPDDCEIAAGTAADLDGDGIPDDCSFLLAPFLYPAGATSPYVKASEHVFVAGYHDLGHSKAVTITRLEPDGGTSMQLETGISDFGFDVAVDDRWLAIASPGAPPTMTGRVAFYELDPAGHFVPSQSVDGSGPYATMGFELARSGPYVYALERWDLAHDFDRVRVFERVEIDGGSPRWIEHPTVELPASSSPAGSEVATEGVWLVVGVPNDISLGLPTSGSVRVYRRHADGTHTLDSVVAPPADLPASSHHFGQFPAVSEDRFIVRASSTWILFRLAGSEWVEEATFPINPSSSMKAIPAFRGGQLAHANPAASGLHRYIHAANGNWVMLPDLTPPLWNSPISIPWVSPWAVSFMGPGRMAFPKKGAVYVVDPVTDCNNNAIDDSNEIAAGLADANRNGIPDECERPGDMDLNGVVDATDLALFLGRWGMGPGWGDLDDDGDVDAADLSILLGDWG